MADTIFRNVLQWISDTSSTNRTVADSKRVGDVTVAQAKRQADAFTTARRITSEYDTVLGKLGATASANLTLLEQKMRDGARETERLKRTTDEAGREVQDLTALYDALEQQAKEAAAATKSVGASGGNAGSTSLNAGLIAGRTAGLGAILGSEAGGSLLPAVAQIIQLTATAGPAGLAVGALAGAARLVTEESQKTTEALKRQGAALLDLQIALPKTTREELQQQLDEAQAALPIAEAFARSASDNVVKYVQAHPEFTYPVTGIVAEAVAGLGGTLGGLQGIADDANTTVDDLQGQIANLLIAMNEQGDTTADLQAAEKALADQRQEIINQQTRIQNDQLQSALQAQQLTAEERAERIKQAEAEIAFRDAYRQSHDLTEEALIANAQAVDQLRNEIVEMTAAHKTYGDSVEYAARKLEAAEARAEALTERNQQILDLEGQYVEAREKALAAGQKAVEAQAEEDERVRQARESSTERLSEIEARGGEQREDILANSQERLRRLTRDTSRDFLEAVGNRDANALRLSKIRTADALEDQAIDDQKRLAQTDKTVSDQLAAERKAGAERVRVAELSGDKTIAAARKEADAQNFYAQQTATSIAFLAATGTQSVVGYHNKMYTDMNTLAFNAGSSLPQSFMNGFNSALGGRAGGSSTFPQVQGYGVINPPGGQAQFNKMFDQRYVQIKQAARGGRTLVP